jgi:hypothetical protein
MITGPEKDLDKRNNKSMPNVSNVNDFLNIRKINLGLILYNKTGISVSFWRRRELSAHAQHDPFGYLEKLRGLESCMADWLLIKRDSAVVTV